MKPEKLKYVWTTGILLGILAAIWICEGCAHNPVPFHRTVHLENVTVHIVDSPAHFKWVKPGVKRYRMMGYATRRNVIYCLGHRNGDGEVVPNQLVLGHEVQHLLNWQDSQIADPDL
jgi:hypothetical protein